MIYVLQEQRDGTTDLAVIDGVNDSILATIPVKYGAAGIVVDANANIIFVSLSSSDSSLLYLIDGTTSQVIAKAPVGLGPDELAIAAIDSGKLYIAYGNGTLSILKVE